MRPHARTRAPDRRYLMHVLCCAVQCSVQVECWARQGVEGLGKGCGTGSSDGAGGR